MMAAASIPTATLARGAQLVGFAVVAAALAIVSWKDTALNLPSVGQFAGIIGSGFLGGIINPLIKSLTGSGSGSSSAQASSAQPSSAQASSAQAGSARSTATAQATQIAEAAQDRAATALGAKSDLMWEAAVVIGAVAIVVAAMALAVNGERHVNAAAALTALATAFGALFVDTSKITHAADTGTAADNGS